MSERGLPNEVRKASNMAKGNGSLVVPRNVKSRVGAQSDIMRIRMSDASLLRAEKDMAKAVERYEGAEVTLLNACVENSPHKPEASTEHLKASRKLDYAEYRVYSGQFQFELLPEQHADLRSLSVRISRSNSEVEIKSLLEQRETILKSVRRIDPTDVKS